MAEGADGRGRRSSVERLRNARKTADAVVQRAASSAGSYVRLSPEQSWDVAEKIVAITRLGLSHTGIAEITGIPVTWVHEAAVQKHLFVYRPYLLALEAAHGEIFRE